MDLISKILLLLLACTRLQGQAADWPIFRGKSDLTGNTGFEFASAPALIWSLPTGQFTKSSPVVKDGLIYFGNGKGTLFAVGTDGKIKWRYESGSPIEAPPLVFANKVIIGLSDGTLRAIDKITGRPIWSYSSDNQIVGSANVWISGKKSGIIFGSYDYYLHCVDPSTGKLLWKIETENYINGTPAVASNRIVFGGCDGMIRVADPLTGKEKDTINIGVYIASSPALNGEKAYFGDYDGTFYCVNLTTKKVTWKIPPNAGSGSILGIPAVGNNTVIVGNEDKYIYCYSSINGKLIWKHRTNDRIVGSPVISPTKVLFGSMDGNIYMIGLSDGRKVWSFNGGASVSSSPAVTRDRFYFLTEDGRLLAFGSK